MVDSDEWVTISGDWNTFDAAKYAVVAWLEEHGCAVGSTDPGDIRLDHFYLGPGRGITWGARVRARSSRNSIGYGFGTMTILS